MQNKQIETYIIVGGGVAGLSAAITLAEAGIKPLLIEASHYPAHRICGEFLSPECLKFLKKWKIPLTETVTHARFISQNQICEFPLDPPAAAASRFHLDQALLDYAVSLGVKVFLETKVVDIKEQNDGTHEISFEKRDPVYGKYLIIGTGRLFSISVSSKKPLKYFGMKSHFEGVDLEDHLLEMHSFPVGYLGISKVGPNTYNVAILIKLSSLEGKSPEQLFQYLMNLPKMDKLKKTFSRAKMIFPHWLFGEVPEFGIRQNPLLKNVSWIGDAAGSIYPACGGGVGMGVTSGVMAADFLLKRKLNFNRHWLKRYKGCFSWGFFLHSLLLSPVLSCLAVKLAKTFSFLPRLIFKQTRL